MATLARCPKSRQLFLKSTSKRDKDMKLRIISESDFDQFDCSRQVIADEQARAFAALDLGAKFGCYGLSWNSSLIEPELTQSAEGHFIWIGVDQQLAAISLLTGRISLALTLQTNLLQILMVDALAVVLTETEVLVFNPNCSIRFSRGLPDIADEMLIVGNKLKILLLESTTFTLDLQTGSISRESAGEQRAGIKRTAFSP